MWIIEWSNLSDYEHNVSAWYSEEEAFKAACSDIINHIDSIDPHSDDELLTVAEVINEHVKNKQYGEAVQYWNDCDWNVGHSGDTMYWIVRQIAAQSYPGEPPTLSLDKYEEEEDEEEVEPIVAVNNHTCILCGNTKCSKRESSCWSCGHPIS